MVFEEPTKTGRSSVHVLLSSRVPVVVVVVVVVAAAAAAAAAVVVVVLIVFVNNDNNDNNDNKQAGSLSCRSSVASSTARRWNRSRHCYHLHSC